MAFWLKIRSAIRHFLGVEDIPSADQVRALELAMRDRHVQWRKGHDDLLHAVTKAAANLEELCGKLDRIETQLIIAHAFEKPSPIPIYDYEQAQLSELAQMLANPPKEQHDGL